MVVIDPGEPREDVRQFADEFGWEFDVLLDPHESVANRYDVWGHPVSFFIGPKGTLLGKVVGFREWDGKEAVRIIEMLMENK